MEHAVVLRRHPFECVGGYGPEGALPDAFPESAVACGQADRLREAVNDPALEQEAVLAVTEHFSCRRDVGGWDQRAPRQAMASR